MYMYYICAYIYIYIYIMALMTVRPGSVYVMARRYGEDEW